jgi:hypothetical protein
MYDVACAKSSCVVSKLQIKILNRLSQNEMVTGPTTMYLSSLNNVITLAHARLSTYLVIVPPQCANDLLELIADVQPAGHNTSRDRAAQQSKV